NDSELGVTNIWINCLVKKDNLVIGVIGTGIELTKYIRAVLDAKQDGVVNMFIDSGGAIQAHPDIKKIEFGLDMKRVIRRKLVLGIADGWLKADGETIFTAKDLRVGLFTDNS
ncbi:MAG: hypothetical protein JKY32_04860, partial [Rhizobiales bacterium]|nr:hypothetical protein [Hyphomicrobiales bacterium]